MQNSLSKFQILLSVFFGLFLLGGCPSSNDPAGEPGNEVSSQRRGGPGGDAEFFYGVYSHIGFPGGRAKVLGTVLREANGDRLLYRSNSGEEFPVGGIITASDGNAVAKVVDGSEATALYNTNLQGTPTGLPNLDRVPMLSLGSTGSAGNPPTAGENQGGVSLVTQIRVFRLENQPGYYELKHLDPTAPQDCPLYTRQPSSSSTTSLVAVSEAFRCPSTIFITTVPLVGFDYIHFCGLSWPGLSNTPGGNSTFPCVYETTDLE